MQAANMSVQAMEVQRPRDRLPDELLDVSQWASVARRPHAPALRVAMHALGCSAGAAP